MCAWLQEGVKLESHVFSHLTIRAQNTRVADGRTENPTHGVQQKWKMVNMFLENPNGAIVMRIAQPCRNQDKHSISAIHYWKILLRLHLGILKFYDYDYCVKIDLEKCVWYVEYEW